MVAPAAKNSSNTASEIRGVSPGWGTATAADAWALTARMSPRASVQELTDATENLYAATRAIAGPAPERPWAMHLANAHGYFRWVCFDLDSGRGNTRADAKKLRRWLRLLGISYLECLSGPTGGRHIWVSVDHLHPQAVHTVGILAKQLLPTLDTTPLSARGNGAVRPPLTPHRTSGYSRPLSDVDDLTDATPVDAAAFRALEQLLEAEGAMLPTPALAGTRGVVADAHGVRYLAGDRRTPSVRIQALLHGTSSELVAFTDYSVLQMVVLTGLARARWRFTDVAAHLNRSPAFEHSRSIPVGGRRMPRSRRDPQTVLRNDWSRAVDFVAANPISRAVDDSDYVARAAPLVDAVEAAQARADALPGYWGTSDTSRSARGHAGRPSWRSVLDAVCVYILRSARADPQINIRRLAADTGYSHEACRLALEALTDADSPWLQRTEDAQGVLAARYQLHPRLRAAPLESFSTENQEEKLAQGITPPPHSHPSRLQPLLRTLTTRLETLNRDLFSAPGSLGRRAGRLLQLLTEDSSPTQELAQRSRSPFGRVRHVLHLLHQAGVVTRTIRGWRREAPHVLDAVNAASPSAGYLERRALTYRAEGVRWRWWQAELHWLRLPRKDKRRRAAAVPTLIPNPAADAPYPAYPRTPDKSPDHRAALSLVLAGAVAQHRAAA